MLTLQSAKTTSDSGWQASYSHLDWFRMQGCGHMGVSKWRKAKVIVERNRSRTFHIPTESIVWPRRLAETHRVPEGRADRGWIRNRLVDLPACRGIDPGHVRREIPSLSCQEDATVFRLDLSETRTADLVTTQRNTLPQVWGPS